jgi:hypothetical protein
MTKCLLAVMLLIGSAASQTAVPFSNEPINHTFHHCTFVGGSGNVPHLFDTSEIYQCDEGKIEIAGRRRMGIEYGYVYETELGRPSCDRPHIATKADYRDYKWCPNPGPQDANQKEMCGDKPTKCFDGKPGTWDSNWQGYSCSTPDHVDAKPPQEPK